MSTRSGRPARHAPSPPPPSATAAVGCKPLPDFLPADQPVIRRRINFSQSMAAHCKIVISSLKGTAQTADLRHISFAGSQLDERPSLAGHSFDESSHSWTQKVSSTPTVFGVALHSYGTESSPFPCGPLCHKS
ncbi:hypothetical protein CEXT_425791 [Caerostris extrusa]|uniref:Uncharacterized protein n=1 Tax=Caerostris extrusa TaxID=172846 RepID=A0AAV4XU37_CAEEX|nr:hypothetical protein CEXT_425791 [Caerostris extrusa]